MVVRKVLFLLLCSMLIVFAAACSSGSNGTEANNVVTDVDGGGNEAGNTTLGEDELEQTNPNATPELDFDLGGRVITWVSSYDETIKDDTPDGAKRLANLEALKEKHNFELEFITIDLGEYQEKVTASLMAGQPVGDIIRLARGQMIPSLTKLDLFWPVDEYVANTDVFLQQDTFEYSYYNGRGYGFKSGINSSARGVIYNRTLMNQLGMKPLQEYVDEDNWNWETFLQVAKEANWDTNNDGKLDTWGLASAPFNFILASNTGANFVIDGKSGLEDPKTLEVLEFMSRLATEQVVRPTEGGDWTEPKQFFTQGNTLMFFGADYDMDSLNTDMSDYDLGFLPTPKGPSATMYHGFVTSPSYLTIPKTVEDPDKILYLYEKIFDIESVYEYPHQAGFEKRFATEEDVNNARETVKNVRFLEIIDGYPNMPYYEIVEELNEGISVSTVVEKYKAQMDSSIAELWAD